MPVPDYQTLMLPLLKLVSDRKEYKLNDAVDILGAQFDLTDEEKSELLPSGQTFLFGSRVGWARTYLKKAGLLDSPKRAVVVITDRGLAILAQKPQKIDVSLLRQFPEFVEFQTPKRNGNPIEEPVIVDEISTQTPEETLENSYQHIRKTLAQDLLNKVVALTPAFFERLVVELLVKMGYGGQSKMRVRRLERVGMKVLMEQLKRTNWDLTLSTFRQKNGRRVT